MPFLLFDLIEIFASSAELDATLISSFLLSSDSGGIGILITSPSIDGLSPRSSFCIALSIS